MNDKKEKFTQKGVVIMTIAACVAWDFIEWMLDKGGGELREILIPAIISSIVSMIFCHAVSIYTFRATANYVNEMMKLMQQIIEDNKDKSSVK